MKKTTSKPVSQPVQPAQPVQPPVVDNHPIQTFRSGVLQLSIWEREITTEQYGVKNMYSFNIERGYTDDKGVWKNTASFRKSDIGSIQALMCKCAEYLLIDEDEEEDVAE
jgi:hypothetical protein